VNTRTLCDIGPKILRVFFSGQSRLPSGSGRDMKYFQGSRGLGTACLAFKGNLKEWKTDERYFESERCLDVKDH
jgi:hypothetical protein